MTAAAQGTATTVTQAVEMLVRRTVRLSDDDMGREWKWGAYDEEGLRFALLMTHHELRDLAVRLAARRVPRTQAQAILAQYHQAYRDLTGALASVTDADLDRLPAPAEWELREILKHILAAEFGFLRVCLFALARPRARRDEEPPDDEWESFGGPLAEERAAAVDKLTSATIDDARNVFADLHVRVLRELGGISDGDVDAPSWFWDGAMPLRFRLHRFEEHLRQHTIQLDKTLATIGRPPTEAQRLVRNIYNALADVEMDPADDAALRSSVAATIAERAKALPV